jgi:hypothetical protein
MTNFLKKKKQFSEDGRVCRQADNVYEFRKERSCKQPFAKIRLKPIDFDLSAPKLNLLNKINLIVAASGRGKTVLASYLIGWMFRAKILQPHNTALIVFGDTNSACMKLHRMNEMAGGKLFDPDKIAFFCKIKTLFGVFKILRDISYQRTAGDIRPLDQDENDLFDDAEEPDLKFDIEKIDKFLFYFDDCNALFKTGGGASRFWEKFATLNRHMQTTVFCNIQDISNLKSELRSNSSNLFTVGKPSQLQQLLRFNSIMPSITPPNFAMLQEQLFSNVFKSIDHTVCLYTSSGVVEKSRKETALSCIYFTVLPEKFVELLNKDPSAASETLKRKGAGVEEDEEPSKKICPEYS